MNKSLTEGQNKNLYRNTFRMDHTVSRKIFYDSSRRNSMALCMKGATAAFSALYVARMIANEREKGRTELNGM